MAITGEGEEEAAVEEAVVEEVGEEEASMYNVEYIPRVSCSNYLRLYRAPVVVSSICICIFYVFHVAWQQLWQEAATAAAVANKSNNTSNSNNCDRQARFKFTKTKRQSRNAIASASEKCRYKCICICISIYHYRVDAQFVLPWRLGRLGPTRPGMSMAHGRTAELLLLLLHSAVIHDIM